MEVLKDIRTLIKRFFFGTPESEVNTNNFPISKMEAKYLRNQLKQEIRKNRALELKLKVVTKTI